MAKTIIEITLPVLPYQHSVTNLAGYLQTIISQMTNTSTIVEINDYDFTDKMSIFRSMRRPSPTHNRINQTQGTVFSRGSALGGIFNSDNLG